MPEFRTRNQSSIDKEYAGSPARERGIIGQNWHDLRLKPEPYLETSRASNRIGHFTRHIELLSDSQRSLPMSSANFHLNMRMCETQKGGFENEPWQHLFQKHDHSFDMLSDAYKTSSKKEIEDPTGLGQVTKPSRPPSNRIDPHRERKVHLEPDGQGSEKHMSYPGKMTANSQRFRGFMESQHTPRRTFGLDHGHDPGKYGPRTHPDSARWMIALRGGTREGEEFRDMKAAQEKLEEEKEKEKEKASK